MRRIVSWTCAWLLAGHIASGPAAGEIASVSVKAGLSAARQHGDAGATDYRTGFGGGVSVAFTISPRVSVQPELLYAMKGGVIPPLDLTDSGGAPVNLGSFTYAVDYVEFPVLARIALADSGRFVPYLVGGPSIGFKLSEELRTDPTEIPDRRDALVNTDVGLAMGVGLEMGPGRRWLIEARYTAGITNVLADPMGYTVRNGAFLVTVGVGWRR